MFPSPCGEEVMKLALAYVYATIYMGCQVSVPLRGRGHEIPRGGSARRVDSLYVSVPLRGRGHEIVTLKDTMTDSKIVSVPLRGRGHEIIQRSRISACNYGGKVSVPLRGRGHEIAQLNALHSIDEFKGFRPLAGKRS